MVRPITELSDEAVEALAEADPLLATYAGVPGHDDRWPDLSPEGHARRAGLAARLASRARDCPVDGSAEDLGRRVLVEDMEELGERHAAGDHLRDLNSIASSLQMLHDVFGVMDDPEAIAARLDGLGSALDGWRRTLAEGIATGVVVSRRQVSACIEQARAWASPDGFAEQAARPGCEQPATAARRAMAETGDWLEAEYLPHAVDEDAVGADRWRREARSHLGTDPDPAATYDWGWHEVRRTTELIEQECGRILPDRPPREAIELLRTDPARAAASAEEFVELMQERQTRALDQLSGTHFEVDERIRTIEVCVAPPGGPLAPHYTPPSEDFSRPGRVWYPLGDRRTFPLWEEVTTAHHEGFPGHHLQVGTQMAAGDRLTRYHRTMAWRPGSGEGWALYAEQLMGELGYLELADHMVGMLAAQAFRACRIVIDIGLHLGFPIPDDAPFHPGERWSPELAVTMLREVAHLDEAMALSEVTRYLGWPAQAVSYKLGERAILELRDERRRDDAAAGRPFDPVRFHSDVLGAGAVGIDLLRDVVRAAAHSDE